VGHGRDWEFLRLGKYDEATGRPIWHAGLRAPGFAAPGQMYCPTGASGLLDGLLFWTDENSLVHVIDDRYGLYVDTLLEDVSRGPTPSPYTVWVELFNTRTFRHKDNGKVYLMAASDAIHIFEVMGVGQAVPRLDGTVDLSAQGIAAVRERLKKMTVSDRRTCSIVRAPGRVTVDGDLDEFARAPASEMVIKDDARGTARVMHDADNLYVAFEVKDSSPMANSGSDPIEAFKTGDTVHLYLGKLPLRERPQAGDVHLMFTRQQGKALAVGYWPVSDVKKQREFRSPSGRTYLDRAEVLTQVSVAAKVVEGGYRIEAAVPLELVGLAGLPPGARIGIDFAINFSDPAGQRNVAKMFWARNAAGMVYDTPTEARLEPKTWGIGVLE